MSLETVIKDIRKAHGENSIKYGSDATGLDFKRIPSGSLSFDIETGGGWVQGHLHEMFGPPSSGKTFLALTTVALNQKLRPEANFAWIKFEPFDVAWAKKLGVDLNRLLLVEAPYLEKGLDIAEALIKSKSVFMLVIDSWGAMCPLAELKNNMEQDTMGLRARLGNKFIRKVIGAHSTLDNNFDFEGFTTVIVINQTYKTMNQWEPETTPGGDALKFNSTIRIKMKRTARDPKEKDHPMVSQETSFLTVKNKSFSPWRNGSFWFSVRDGVKGKAGEIWTLGEIIDYGIMLEVLESSGAWYKLPDELGGQKVHGVPGVVKWAQEAGEEQVEELKKMIMERVW